LQAAGAGLWWRYSDRFGIPLSVLLAGAGLLETGILAWYNTRFLPRYRSHLTLGTAVSLVMLSGLVSFETKRILFPAQFPRAAFGVAVAQFGEGPHFQNTGRAQDISQAVFQQLSQQAQRDPNSPLIQFRQIGLVRSQQEAAADGQRVGADLVIWGRIQVSEERTILNFSILETPDKISNPNFPRVLPLFEPSADGTVVIDSRGTEDISRGTTAISAFTFGLAHFFNWDFRAAARAFEEAPVTTLREDDDYRYLLHLYYGLSLQRPGQIVRADEEFQKAISLHEDDPAPKLARAFGLNALGKTSEARAEAEQAIELCNEKIRIGEWVHVAYYDRALAYEILQDWEAALADYRAAMQVEPDLFIARIGAIRMHLALDETANAMQEAQAAIELAERTGGNAAWPYLYLGYAQARNGNIVEARDAYDQASRLEYGVDWIHYMAGRFYAETGEPEDLPAAEREFQAMIDVTSDPAWGHSSLASFYAGQNRLEDAVREYQAALQVNREAAGVWVSLAHVYYDLEKVDDARKAYSRAVEIEPDNFYARFSYGNFLFGQGELEAALRHWEAAHAIDPRHCGLILNIGRGYEYLGDAAHAATLYQTILSGAVSPDPECQAEALRRINRSP
jgi:tetratricopeptide (TPR) repeat protein